MFNDFLLSYSTFETSGVENSLFETLRLFDLLSSGAFRRTNLSLLDEENIDLGDLIRKRKQGIPWEYILEQAHFMGQLFFCSPDTLIPKDETKLLVDAALESINKRERVDNDLALIEIGTGCGNIAVTLAMHSRNTKILASDISPAAVNVAQKNVYKFNLQNRIALFAGDLFSPFESLGYEGKIDFVVCNPPYIPTGSLSRLSGEFVVHEPRVALDGGPCGIDFYHRLIAESLPMLKPGGMLFFEIGERQEKPVIRLLENNGGYYDIEFFTDNANVRAIRTVKKRI
jgi:release factor glutamine methyltransferase